jgi:hypothetical protein
MNEVAAAAEYAKIRPNIAVKKAPPLDSKEWEGRPEKPNTSHQIPARVIEADSARAATFTSQFASLMRAKVDTRGKQHDRGSC